MKSLILLGLISLTFAAITFDLTKYCVCTDYKVSSDCTSYYCVWESSACRAIKCADYTTSAWCGSYPYCKWDTTCKDYTVKCSDFTTAATCDALFSKYNCAWTGTACANFTKCSDYIPGKTGCELKSSSSQTCQNNAAGTQCENYVPPAIPTCASQTTLAKCSDIYISNCVWDTVCTDLTSCTQLTTSKMCGYYQFCFWDTTCRTITCADFTVDTNCVFAHHFRKKSATLCNWDTTTQKCSDTVDTSALDTARCMGYYHHIFTWDGTKCTLCESIKSNSDSSSTNTGSSPTNSGSSSTNPDSNSSIGSSSTNSGSSSTNQGSSSTNSGSSSTNPDSSSSNTESNSTNPDSNSSNNSESTSSNSNTTNSGSANPGSNSGSSSSPGTTLFTDFNNTCACPELKQQEECKNLSKCFWEKDSCRLITCADQTQSTCSGSGKCIWDTACRQKVCSDYETEQDCDYLSRQDNCSWNGSCSTFTKCSDYTPGTRGCQFKSGSAQKCQNNFAGTACENVPTSTCSDFTTDMDCYNSSIGLCHFDTTCKHITNCSQFMSSTSCTDSHMCIYDTACREMSCSDYPKDNCHYVHTLQTKEGTNTGYLCKWDDINSNCVAAQDTTHLTKETCNSFTNQNYSWDGSKCSKCASIEDTSTGKTTSGVVLGMIVSLSVLFI